MNRKIALYNYPIRSSTIVTALRIVSVVLIGILLSFVSYIPLVLLKAIFSFEAPIIFISILIQIAILVLVSLGIVSLLMKWAGTSYVIKDSEIIVQQGIFNIKQKIYPLEGHEEVKIYKSFFGKIFDYGTLSIYQPVLQKYITLENIQDPDLFAEVIRQTKSKESLSSERVIFSRKKKK
ncbi:PH domain-containing protein [Candidatus Roizmanbacteria bacterium]|nr:MAG: PH domain-containing protein [Candidatus Roizmanbacteria bacterium]